jgi:hypothetical protein
MNGATEATLADLLATAQAMNVNLIKLQQLAKSGGGGGGSGSAASSVASVAASLNPLSLAFGAAKIAVGAVGAVFGVMGSILGKVVGIATNLASSLTNLGFATAMTGTKLSEFYGAFADALKNIPLVGMAFDIFSKVIAYQEQLLSFFQQITMNGASFSGSLNAMKAAATRSYMSMQDFATIIRDNSETFATMGGIVTGGVNKFVEIQNKMLGPRSEYANIMYGMGYTAKTAGDMLAHYMRIQGTMNKEGIESNEAIIKGTVSAAKELDILSQLTGKNNLDLKKKAEQLQADEAFEAFKVGKTAQQVSAMDTIVKSFLAFGNETGATQAKLALMGANVLKTADMQADFVVSGGKTTQLIDQVVGQFNRGQFSNLSRTIATGSYEIGRSATQYRQTLGVTSAFLEGSMAKAGQGYTKTYRDYASSSDIIIKEISARKNSADAAKGSAAELERAQQGIRNFGEQIVMLAGQIIAPFIPLMQAFANQVVKYGKDIANLVGRLVNSDGFKGAIEGTINWFRTTFRELSTSTNATDFFSKFGNRLGVAFDAMKPVLEVIFNKFIDFMKPHMIQMLNTVEDYVNATMFQKTGKLFGAEDPEIRKKQRAYEKLELVAQTLYDKAGALSTAGNSPAALRTTEEAAAARALAMDAKKIWENAKKAPTNSASAQSGIGGFRSKGTIGMTGNWWEKEDATLAVSRDEMLAKPEQVRQIVNTARQDGYAEAMQQVNNTQLSMVAVLNRIADASERNVTATKRLDGNLFATA